MRYLGKVSLIAVLAILAGCNTVARELRYPGGATGKIYDKQTYDASESKDLQLFRATMLQAAIARMATGTVRDGEDGDAFVKYLVAMSDEINYAAANIRDTKDNKVCTVGLRKDNKPVISRDEDGEQIGADCSGYYMMFESDMSLIDGRTFRLVLAALPSDRVDEFVDNAKSGNVIAAAFGAVRSFAQASDGLRRSAGVYRSSIEGVAANLIANGKSCADGPIVDGSPPKFSETSSSVLFASRCLGVEDLNFGDHPYELKGRDLDIQISDRSFDAMFRLARAACVTVPFAKGNDPSAAIDARDKQCAEIVFKPKPRKLFLETDYPPTENETVNDPPVEPNPEVVVGQ